MTARSVSSSIFGSNDLAPPAPTPFSSTERVYIGRILTTDVTSQNVTPSRIGSSVRPLGYHLASIKKVSWSSFHCPPLAYMRRKHTGISLTSAFDANSRAKDSLVECTDSSLTRISCYLSLAERAIKSINPITCPIRLAEVALFSDMEASVMWFKCTVNAEVVFIGPQMGSFSWVALWNWLPIDFCLRCGIRP